MKRIFTGLLLLGSISASASLLGLPDQDPIVSDLRSQFKKATLPTESQLQQGKTWFCNYYFAYKDDFTKKSQISFYNFSFAESYLMNIRSSVMGEYVISDDNRSYVGLHRDHLGDREFLRITKGGSIIAEYVEIKKEKNKHITAPSIADSRYRTIGYTICPKSLAKHVKNNYLSI